MPSPQLVRAPGRGEAADSTNLRRHRWRKRAAWGVTAWLVCSWALDTPAASRAARGERCVAMYMCPRTLPCPASTVGRGRWRPSTSAQDLRSTWEASCRPAGKETLTGIARWDGVGWHALGTGVDGGIRAFAEYDDGNGAGALRRRLVHRDGTESPRGRSHAGTVRGRPRLGPTAADLSTLLRCSTMAAGRRSTPAVALPRSVVSTPASSPATTARRGNRSPHPVVPGIFWLSLLVRGVRAMDRAPPSTPAVR